MTKRYGRTSLGAGLLLALVGSGLSCTNNPEAEDVPVSEENPFGVLMEGLGDEVTSCTGATTSTLVDGVLTVTLAADQDAVVSAVNKKLLFNGIQCAETESDPDVPLTTDNVDKLVILSAGTGTSDHKVVIDLLPGTFGTNLMGNSGGVTIRKGDASDDVSVGIRGTASADNIRFAEDTNNNVYVELTGNLVADLLLEGASFGTNADNTLTVALVDGNDKFNAQDNSNLTALNLVGSAPTLGAVAATRSITAFGGNGTDTMEGGLGDDILFGGAGDDTFETFSDDDGADTYDGGAGEDTLTYEDRTDAVDVRIHPGFTTPWLRSDVSLFNTSSTNASTFSLAVDGGTPVVVTPSAANLSANDLLGEITTQLAGEDVAVSMDTEGKLVLVGTAITDDLAVVATATTIFSADVTAADTTATTITPDNDDGKTGEADEVLSSIENITGGSGNDTLFGSNVSNVIEGGAGDDTISGGVGAAAIDASCEDVDEDSLDGGDGDDTFLMGPVPECRDDVTGGDGTDTVDYQMRVLPLVIKLNNSADDGDDAAADETDNIRSTVEVVLGGEGADTITGSSGNETLRGNLGADTIDGGSGDDTIAGNDGADTIIGGAGDDTIDESLDADTAFIKGAAPATGLTATTSWGGGDTIHGGTGTNICNYRRTVDVAGTYELCFSSNATNCAANPVSGPTAGSPTDALNDLTNCTHLITGGDVDDITGSLDDDIIEAGGGDDVVDGQAGNDIIYGEAGADDLTGGDGDDTLDDGAGTDTNIDGGDGEDVCLPGDGETPVNCEIQ